MGDLSLFAPEASVFVAALVAFALSAFGASDKTAWKVSVVMGLVVLGLTGAWLDAVGEPFFPGIYRVDLFSQLLKLGIALGLMLTLLVSGDLGSFRARSRVDIPIFLFMSALGMMMLVSATELLTLYVALELSAYGLYIMAALSRHQRTGSEGAAKYILFGAASSAVTLFGMSLIFGAARSTYLVDILTADGLTASPLFVVGLLMALAGMLFKLGVFPFHAWAPDTYESAPHQSATFIGTTSKVAAVGVLVRALTLAPEGGGELTDVLLILCVASMFWGNLAALVQKDVKRLLAYSTIAHAGYVLIGLATFSELGVASAIFYGLVYVVLAFLPFLVVCRLGADGSSVTFASLAGLYKRSPFLALALLVGMFGLAGIPPTPGFAGKWFLFSAALAKGHFLLVLLAAVSATISLYYYLRLVKEAYLTPPGDLGAVAMSPAYVVATYVCFGLILFTGFYPGPVWDLAVGAAQLMMGG